MTPSQLEAAIYEAWDFADPDASRQEFQIRSDSAKSESTRQIWRTQIGRSYGLEKDFARAREILGDVEAKQAFIPPGPEKHHLRARQAIEWARVLNSEGDPTSARSFFDRAYEEAEAAGAEGLAIDALHMIAIVEGRTGGPNQSRRWNERALALARQSQDPDARRWRASLLNNLAWDLHDAGDAAGALTLFEEALTLRLESGQAAATEMAEWAVGRTLRTLGRHEEALAVQRRLASEPPGAEDGYVHEELGENLQALGREAEASVSFARARELLGQEPASG